MITLDTNILIEHIKGNPVISTELRFIGLDELAISPVVAAELYQGALNKQELQVLRTVLTSYCMLPLEAAIGERMLDLLQQYALSHRLQFPDALIAATALHHNLPLFTLNRKDFRYIAGLMPHEPT